MKQKIWRSAFLMVGVSLMMLQLTEGDPRPDNPFGMSLYQPTYIMPFFYTSSPNQQAYEGQTGYPTLDTMSVNFQISLKYPLWKITNKHTLNLAYTQMSFWQAYQRDSFFRETDYAPEIFLANTIDEPMGARWQLKFLNIGLIHQSNGEGGTLERSWNRAYLDGIFSTQYWSVSLEPWYIFHDSTYTEQNPDMAHYMGYGQTIVSYHTGEQAWSLMARNQLESGFKRGALQMTWRFSIWHNVQGYILLFRGYGESLMAYDHGTNSIGLGVLLGGNAQ